MNTVDKVLKNRRSYREYNKEVISDDVILNTLKLARRTATSVNGQQISMVVTREKEKLKEIADMSWGQKHILNAQAFITFVVDFNRPLGAIHSLGNTMGIIEEMESILVGAVDAGLMAQSVELLFQSQEIGTCMIGAIRGDMQKINEILNISGNAFAIFGLTVGCVDQFKSTELDIRPRSKDSSAIFIESYNEKVAYDSGAQYSEELSKWWEEKKMPQHRSYAQSMSQYYEKTYVNDLLLNLQRAGFLKNFEKK